MAPVPSRYWLIPNETRGRDLLETMMRHLAGAGSCLSLEGHFRALDLTNLGEPCFRTSLRREGISKPPTSFVTARLTEDCWKSVFEQIVACPTWDQEIVHLQIERDGKAEFGAYDNFHPDCVHAGGGVAPEMLHELVRTGVLSRFALKRDRPT